MNSLIEERDERTRKRKKIKRKMDSIIGLSYHDKDKRVLSVSLDSMKLGDNTIRLLDEGYFDNGFVIKKGTLEKYLNGQNQYVTGYEMGEDGWQRTDVLNLTDDFVGTVNLGHMEFSVFPFVIGEWDKRDLTLVDTENGRKALDVALRLDEDSVFVKELKRQPFDIGVSAEFYYHVNEADTESLSEMLGYYMPVIDEVFIFAYGLVGECGNVNSSGLELKGETMLTDKEKLMAEENVSVEIELDGAEEAIEQIEEVTEELGVEEIDITVNEEEGTTEESTEVDEEEPEEEENDVELSADDAEGEDEDEAEEDESDEESENEEVSEDEADDEDEADEADELTQALALIKALKAENAGLKDIIAELKKNNRKNAKKLAQEKEAKAKFLEATKELSVELLPNEGVEKEKVSDEMIANRNYIYGDGIKE